MNLVEYGARDINLVGPGDRFQARGNVDPIAMNIIIFDNDVANIDANAKSDASIFRFVGFEHLKLALDLCRAGDSLNSRREFQ